ncbi:GDP-D-mannose dehydratase [Paraburkholderia sp. UCT70]
MASHAGFVPTDRTEITDSQKSICALAHTRPTYVGNFGARRSFVGGESPCSPRNATHVAPIGAYRLATLMQARATSRRRLIT